MPEVAPLPVPRAIFSRLRIPRPRALGLSEELRGFGDLLMDIIREIESGASREEVEVEELSSYTVRGLLSVKLGWARGRLYYVVNEPGYSAEDARSVIELIIRDVEESAYEKRIRSLLLSKSLSPRDYLYFKAASGYGPLSPFVLDEKLEEISLSSMDGRVRALHSDFSWHGWAESNIIVSPAAANRLVLSLARRARKHISLQRPVAEGVLDGRIRASLSLGESVTPGGSTVVLRKGKEEVWTIARSIKEGAITSVLAAYLWLVMENRGWVIIAGGVGSGKTTLLQGLLTLIPPGKRVVTIEDVQEIRGTTGIWDPLVERAEVFGDEPELSAAALLKYALRRRPDYIVIGEARGPEARLLVQASRLGHGVLTTLHADSPGSVIARLTAPPINIPRNLLNNVWSIVVMDLAGGHRSVRSAAEVEGGDISEICGGPVEMCRVDDIARGSARLVGIYGGDGLRRELVRRSSFLEGLAQREGLGLDEMRAELSRFYLLSRTRGVGDVGALG